MFPAIWQRTNPTNPANPVNECGGTDTPFGPAPAEMLEARCADCRALAAMPDTRIYTKNADAFNTEDVPGDMAADESYESGE